jgi:methyltransferase (TIGR00027 family)
MRPEQRSRTAEGTAAMRAAHQILDDEPPVLLDPYAERLLGSALAPALRPWTAMRRRAETRFWSAMPKQAGKLPIGTRRMRAQVVVRSRYAEDELERAIERGVDQFVVLAAGFDTFALRRPDLADRVTVYEVDHPATQAEKRRRIESNGIAWPENLELIPIDFERESLADACARSSLDPSRPAFFSWLGVTYYLSAEAILDTLRFVTGQARGSELVLDFWSAEERSPVDRALLIAVRFSVASIGEQMISFFGPDSMAELIAKAGLRTLEMLGKKEADRRYLEERRDGLAMPEFAYLAKVSVE